MPGTAPPISRTTCTRPPWRAWDRTGCGSARGVSERVFVRTPDGWKVAVTTAFPTANVAPPATALVGATLVDPAGADPVRDAVVVMRDGRIGCAGQRAAGPVPADGHTVSAAGHWDLP